MADEKDTEKRNDAEQQGPDEKTSNRSYLKWIIMAVVVAFCASAGFGLGRLFGGSDTSGTAKPSQQTEPSQTQLVKADVSAADSQETWYYNFEPVVANLNEPGVTRYIRVTLTLQISTELDQKKGTALLEEKNPILKNWLTIYLANQTLEDTRGDRNLRRIQLEITDTFNEKLFPDAKPKIKNVLFKEFTIQ